MADTGIKEKGRSVVGNKIKIIKGPIDPADAYSIITTSEEPILFKSMIEHWKARQWTIDFFCKKFCNIPTTFKICPLEMKEPTDRPIMETDCIFVQGKVGYFSKWMNGEKEDGSSLNLFPRNEFSVYIDYKHMKDMFVNDESKVLKDIDWEVFGYHGRDGNQSTIWIGSSHAFTPLHKDTYGCNLVAQLSGRKSWTMFHPKDTDKLYPIRIPYEESSIFSAVNLESPDYNKYPKFADARKYMVILEPGDALYIPKHWWHFVRNIEASISVNMWITKSSDDFDQIKEAVVRLLVSSIKGFECQDNKYWLNPNEEQMPVATNLEYIKHAIEKSSPKEIHFGKEKKEELDRYFKNSDFFINCLTSDKVINLIVQEMLSRT